MKSNSKKVLALVLSFALLIAMAAVAFATTGAGNPAEDTTAAEEVVDTTAAAEDTTAAEEDTTAAEEDTTAAEEDTTAAEEDTTAAEEDTTAAAEEDTTAAAEEDTTAAGDDETTKAAEEDTTAADDDYILGDVDGNGKVKARDARLALRMAAKLENEANWGPEKSAYDWAKALKVADYTLDGFVKALDARCILRVAAGLAAYSQTQGATEAFVYDCTDIAD